MDDMNQDFAEMPLEDDIAREDEAVPETVPVPSSLVPHLSETAILLDVDGTLLDLMPTPREVWVPPGLSKTLNRLLRRTGGALALVSGRSLNDIDLIFAPDQYLAVGGHGAEMRLDTDRDAADIHAPPMDKELKRRLAAIAIMPDLDGLAFSVGRRAKGVAGHFDAPSDVREFLAHLLDDERTASLP